MLCLCLLLLVFRLLTVQGEKSSSYFLSAVKNFDGINYWHSNVIAKCGMLPADGSSFYEEIDNTSLFCYVYRVYLTFVKVEVLSIHPPLIKFPRFLPKSHIQDWIKLSKSLQLSALLIKSQDNKTENVVNSARVVNGTFIAHDHSQITRQTFKYIQNKIQAFDFKRAERFQILHYRPGGHYALHYDYFTKNHDLEALGNRLATFMVILKRADIGGSTLFPELGVNFNPRVGDAVVWFNMNPDYTCATGAKHGACPVIKGEKIGLTLWVRTKGQELLYKCSLKQHASFNIAPLIGRQI